MVGLCTDICVISNALLAKAFLPAALLGIQVVGLVGVLGYDDFAVKVLDFLTHRRHNGLGFAGAKSSVHKIFLHIDDNQHTHRLSSTRMRYGPCRCAR